MLSSLVAVDSQLILPRTLIFDIVRLVTLIELSKEGLDTTCMFPSNMELCVY